VPPPARSRPALLHLRPLAALAAASLAVAAWAPLAFALPALASPPAPTVTGPPGAGRVPALRLPVGGPVVRGFEPPSGPFGPGHRGVDLAAPLGTPVVAPAAGRVVFAGLVAGLGWVSLGVAPGVVVTVGPLDQPAVGAGRSVPALARLGRLAPGHGGRLHLGLRLDGAYVDPLPYLVGHGPPRLAPLSLPG
jgi:murein DD-endopeptidase MepM/ murein hydrolase activator NlpD